MRRVVRGVCALCKKEAELQDSHIIPALVNDRIKSHPNSRFRSLDNINRVLQNGETHYMLCHDCEERFSALEATFGRFFLDEYLKTGVLPTVNDEKRLKDYIMSVAWRVLWDDLYRLGSFAEESYRGEFERFEQKLRAYLLNGGDDSIFPCVIDELKNVVDCPESIAKSTMISYSAYHPIYGCYILVYYSGLVFVTGYYDHRRIVILDGVEKKSFQDVVAEELCYSLNESIRQRKEKITPELREKIRKRYQ